VQLGVKRACVHCDEARCDARTSSVCGRSGRRNAIRSGPCASLHWATGWPMRCRRTRTPSSLMEPSPHRLWQRPCCPCTIPSCGLAVAYLTGSVAHPSERLPLARNWSQNLGVGWSRFNAPRAVREESPFLQRPRAVKPRSRGVPRSHDGQACPANGGQEATMRLKPSSGTIE
jgi:hypothetical protein